VTSTLGFPKAVSGRVGVVGSGITRMLRPRTQRPSGSLAASRTGLHRRLVVLLAVARGIGAGERDGLEIGIARVVRVVAAAAHFGPLDETSEF
jgi:hypothetical protein